MAISLNTLIDIYPNINDQDHNSNDNIFVLYWQSLGPSVPEEHPLLTDWLCHVHPQNVAQPLNVQTTMLLLKKHIIIGKQLSHQLPVLIYQADRGGSPAPPLPP